MDTLQTNKKHMELERMMVNLFPCYIKKHPLKECPLDTLETCAIFEENHSISACPSLPALQAVFQGTNEEPYQLCFMGSKKPLQPWSLDLNPSTSRDPFKYYNMNPQ